MKKRRLIKTKVIFLATILSMSILGVGYSSWEENNNIRLSVKTGFINPVFYVDDEKISFGDEKLVLIPSDDGRTLYVEGEVYPSFNNDISIKIIDEGSIPSVFNNLYENNDNIATLTGLSNSKQQRSSLNIKNDYIESFEININPNCDNKIQSSEANTISKGSITELENEIEMLKEKIRLYDREENYDFEYVLSFEQGI
ncbi:MAG: hypothetical protein K0R54_4686 [Clostridiaceae bacterium]|jgi:hypothetical protein|nr:hypothetical protein [Clostridiaceae bacterium]